jgi:hypothetical protein
MWKRIKRTGGLLKSVQHYPHILLAYDQTPWFKFMVAYVKKTS